MTPTSPSVRPLFQLDATEQELVERLVLASGSLKELARGYGVSYPTIRTRLDRLIEKLKELRAGQRVDPMSDLLADLVDRGELTLPAARSIRELHRSTHDARTENAR